MGSSRMFSSSVEEGNDDLACLMPLSYAKALDAGESSLETENIEDYKKVCNRQIGWPLRSSLEEIEEEERVNTVVYGPRRMRMMAKKRRGTGRETSRTLNMQGRQALPVCQRLVVRASNDIQDLDSLHESDNEADSRRAAAQKLAQIREQKQMVESTSRVLESENIPPAGYRRQSEIFRKLHPHDKKRKGSGRNTVRRTFGLDLKQICLPADNWDEEDLEVEEEVVPCAKEFVAGRPPALGLLEVGSMAGKAVSKTPLAKAYEIRGILETVRLQETDKAAQPLAHSVVEIVQHFETLQSQAEPAGITGSVEAAHDLAEKTPRTRKACPVNSDEDNGTANSSPYNIDAPAYQEQEPEHAFEAMEEERGQSEEEYNDEEIEAAAKGPEEESGGRVRETVDENREQAREDYSDEDTTAGIEADQNLAHRTSTGVAKLPPSDALVSIRPAEDLLVNKSASSSVGPKRLAFGSPSVALVPAAGSDKFSRNKEKTLKKTRKLVKPLSRFAGSAESPSGDHCTHDTERPLHDDSDRRRSPMDAEEPLQEDSGDELDRSKRKSKKARAKLRQSLADAGSNWQGGVRRSTRRKVRPLEYWRNERLVYGRKHQKRTGSPAPYV
eukprot:jgi/Mesen1/9020/ME000565S08351